MAEELPSAEPDPAGAKCPWEARASALAAAHIPSMPTLAFPGGWAFSGSPFPFRQLFFSKRELPPLWGAEN